MIFTKYLLPFVVLCIFRAFEVSACTGCIQLDEYTFDKLINKFGAVLVKFDVAFPYGDEHEAYAKIAKDAKSHDDLLIAEVGIKDYGQKDNEILAQRYNIKKDDYPVVKLFLKNKKEPITLSEKPLTQDNLQKFLRANSGIHLSGPGCIPKLDTLAIIFLDTHPDKRTKISDEANIIINTLPEKDKKTGSVYLQIMKKITDKGEDFIKNENDRLMKLLDGKISEDKKKEISTKLNILKSFSDVNEKAKDEL